MDTNNAELAEPKPSGETVFILVYDVPYEFTYVIGVFRTLSAAFARQEIEQGNPNHVGGEFQINEYEVNGASASIDRTVEADARRFRWLLAGNGYFMEEEGICHVDYSEAEQDRARKLIDEESGNC